MHEKENQTDQRSSPQSSAVLMSRCHAKKSVVKEKQALVNKENKAYEEASAVRSARCATGWAPTKRRRTKKDTCWVICLMCRKRSMTECAGESMKTLQQPVLVRCQQMRSRRVKYGLGHNECARARQLRIRHFCHRRKASCDRSALAVSRGRKTCRRGRCMWNDRILLLILALAPIREWANSSAHNLRECRVPASTSPAVQPKPVRESRGQDLEQGHRCLESVGIRPQRRGSGVSFTPLRRSSRRKRGPDEQKERPFDVGSSSANQPLFVEDGDV